MYTLKTTFIRSYDATVGVREINASNMNIRELISGNAEVKLVLTNTFLQGDHVLDLKDAYSRIYANHPSTTVSQWLTLNGNQSLPTTPGTIKVNPKRAKSMDAFEAGFSVAASSGWTGSDAPSFLISEREHISIIKEDVDHSEMRKFTLASIAGYLHITDGDPTAIYVRDGMNTQRISKSPKVQLTSFANIGELNLIPIRNCTLTPTNGVEFSSGVTITTDADLDNKTVWLSIGGYLYYGNKDYAIANKHSIKLDWKRINFARKYMVSREYIDLTPVNAALGLGEEVQDIMSYSQLNSDAAIGAYLRLTQSFLIIIDNPTVYVDSIRVEDSGLPGKFYVYGDPYKLYKTSDGRIANTSIINEHKANVVSVPIPQAMTPEFISETFNEEENELYIDSKIYARPHRASALYKIDIKTSEMEVVRT